MSTNSERITGKGAGSPTARKLYDAAATRRLEQLHGSPAGSASLMTLAGEATARLAMAIAPHARDIWVACGPGNNGGDGFQAAALLKRWGKNPVVSYLPGASPSSDALAAQAAAQQAGITFSAEVPQSFDLAIDALFGIGALRTFHETHARWIEQMNSSGKPLLAVDLPSGLDGNTGAVQPLSVRASHTLSLLTLKPGLFTANGRDACGEIWFNALGVSVHERAIAELISSPAARRRQHSSHKGSYGDVAVVGGAQGMTGAALLAAQAALHGGAGRVMVCLLSKVHAGCDACQPELMFRGVDQIAWETTTGVVGCGGSSDIGAQLPDVLRNAHRLVLDADALNCLAAHPPLKALLAAREAIATVMTPHPLEAARLLQTSTAAVQSDRLAAAQALSERFNCTVVLKGSGTVVASPGETLRINTTGNGRLATAGTGDVLAGLVGAHLAAGQTASVAAREAVYRHGQVADAWPHPSLTAAALAQALGS